MNINVVMSNLEPIKVETINPGPAESIMTEELNQKLLDYILPRLQSDETTRLARITRYGRIDRMLSGWQKLSEEDSFRQDREENTGAPQGIAAVIPIADSQVEETAAFFTEIFAPASGNFYSNQGDPAKVEQITLLAQDMENDYKLTGYYDSVATVMRSFLKYNIAAFELKWKSPDEEAVGADKLGGNVIDPIPLYNFYYDQSVDSLKDLRTKGEWYAKITKENLMYLLKGAERGEFVNVKKVIDSRGTSNYSNGFDCRFYREPPTDVGLNDTGLDDSTSGGSSTNGVNWGSFGLSLTGEKGATIQGFEVIHVKIWLNPDQFGLAETETLNLYDIMIVDSKFVIKCEAIENAKELPIYGDYLRSDEMKQAHKSYAESMKAFQRHISFMANIAIAIERGNTYGLKAIDPAMFDAADFKPGETSGVLVSKTPGRDVRAGILPLNTANDTAQQYSAIANLLQIMKEMFPNQGLPSQVAGLDRAVTSQVAAVMIGAVRRLHMLVRRIDSSVMNPMRVGSYRNYVAYSSESSKYGKLTEKDVANLLNSGLGQLNREVASGAIERLLFTLIQNPDSAAQFDLPLLFRVWSQMLNTGVDLGKLVSQTGAAGQQGAVATPDPEAAQQAAVTVNPDQGGAV